MSLSPAREALIALSAALGSRRRERLEPALRDASEHAAAAAVEEVLLQSHLFVGIPDALEAMVLWREVSGAPPPPASAEPAALWEERGPEVCAAVYGGNYGKLRRNVVALHPELDRWMVVGGYGRVIGRPGLDLATRELCIAALLAVWGAPRQLHSHLRGALNAGAPVAEVDRAVEIACGLLEVSQAAPVRELWAKVARSTP